jgi:hypothetical protein
VRETSKTAAHYAAWKRLGRAFGYYKVSLQRSAALCTYLLFVAAAAAAAAAAAVVVVIMMMMMGACVVASRRIRTSPTSFCRKR